MKRLKKLFRDNLYLILLAGVILLFFYPVILQGKIPIPADTIVGMYHPWRDNIWNNLTSGVPYKNFLITDPVRQQYVWRSLAIEQFKNGQLPVWNPYSFSGTPLLANFQTAAFYPLNIMFFLLPFNLAWTILIMLQPLLSGIFLYLYLCHIKVSKIGSFLGGLTFAFSGFSIAWMEWNTIGHTIAWLPLSLLAIEKIFQGGKRIWPLLFIFSLVSSFFAGHLQVFFYSFLVISGYIIIRVLSLQKNKLRFFLSFIFYLLSFIFITSIQWLPTFQFIANSARNFDQRSWMSIEWFIPWQHLIQFVAPDFFGNPATGNYWGIWNYGEFIGYVGIAPLILALYSLFSRRDKKTFFFGGFIILSLLFALPTPLAKIPYQLQIPLISTSQPTRLIFIIDFSLAILAALGLDQLMKDEKIKKFILLLTTFITILVGLWLIFSIFGLFIIDNNQHVDIIKRNLILPTILIIFNFLIFIFFAKNRRNVRYIVSIVLLVLLIFDLFRFGWKFTPFSKAEWIFPRTEILDTLTHDKSYYRVMVLDRRILPPNFAAAYGIYDVAGYDPLYLKEYGQLVASWERDKPDITPASFNRILTPSNYENFISDLLGVRFILSFGPLKSDKFLLESIHEGETYLYLNTNIIPRAFLVEEVVKAGNQKESLEKMYNLKASLRNTAVVTDNIILDKKSLGSYESVEITSYSANKIELRSYTSVPRLLVLTDMYYPSWKAYIGGKETKIYRVDFALRGIVIPAGTHKIEFKNNLL